MIKQVFRSMKTMVSIVLAALCAGSSAFIYEANVNPGHGAMSPWNIAGIASLAAGAWAWIVFPKMGRGWITDLLWITAAFPFVGGVAGLLAALGHPLGILMGAYVALMLPVLFPVKVLPIYLIGAMLAFTLPRVSPRT
ncbi:hypothetical protein [Aestuariibius sp. HNIBRBA575]|uniref:hypothetical protein n=1 Tax=Aestuariibius sp. HNIBRBA575 TaxID=3233343 RepID=UPI0034A4AEFC